MRVGAVVLTISVGQRHYLRHFPAHYRPADLGVALGDLQTLVYSVAVSHPSRKAAGPLFVLPPTSSAVLASKQTPSAPGDSLFVRLGVV